MLYFFRKEVVVFCAVFYFSFSAFARQDSSKDWAHRLQEYETQERERYQQPVQLNLKVLQLQLDAWEGLKLRLRLLSDVSKKLYDPTRSPFRETHVVSSDPRSFTATSVIGAEPAEYRLHVKNIALRDKISSRWIDTSIRFLPARFDILSAGKRVTVNFGGGALLDLKVALEKVQDRFYDVSLLQVDKNQEVLVIQGKEPGTKNQLVFQGEKEFLSNIGFIQSPHKDKTVSYLQLAHLESQRVKGEYLVYTTQSMRPDSFEQSLQNPAQASDPVSEKDLEILELKPDSQVLFVVPEGARGESVEFEYRIEAADPMPENPSAGFLQDLVTPFIDSVQLQDIQIYGEPVIEELESSDDSANTILTQKLPDAKYSLVFLNKDRQVQGKALSLEAQQAGQWVQFRGKLSELGVTPHTIHALLLTNASHDQKYSLRRLRLYNDAQVLPENDYNYLQKAQDAQLLVDELLMSRSSNLVENLFPGVSVTLLSPSEYPGTLTITYNFDQMLELISHFADEYNNTMLYINNLSIARPRLKLEDLEEQEKQLKLKSDEDQQYSKLSGEYYKGVLYGEHSVRFLKQQLRQLLTGTPYDASFEQDIKFLTQIGFKNPDQGANKADLENIVAGYIALDKDILKKQLEAHINQVSQLFAYSINDGFLKDKGIAVSFVNILDPYIKKVIRDPNGISRSGIIENNKLTLENTIKEKKKVLESIEKMIEKRVQKFKVQIEKIKHLEMEQEQKLGAIRGLEDKRK